MLRLSKVKTNACKSNNNNLPLPRTESDNQKRLQVNGKKVWHWLFYLLTNHSSPVLRTAGFAIVIVKYCPEWKLIAVELTNAVMQRPGEQHLQVMDNTSVWSGIEMATVTTSNILWLICQLVLNQKVIDGSSYHLPMPSFGAHMS